MFFFEGIRNRGSFKFILIFIISILFIYIFIYVLSYFVSLLEYLKPFFSSQFANFKQWPLQAKAIFSLSQTLATLKGL